MQRSFPNTAAGQSRILTGFPFQRRLAMAYLGRFENSRSNPASGAKRNETKSNGYRVCLVAIDGNISAGPSSFAPHVLAEPPIYRRSNSGPGASEPARIQ